MAGSDLMLDSAGAAERGFVNYGSGYIDLYETRRNAERLQQEAMSAKLAGDHNLAVKLYRELLPVVTILDQLDALLLPSGMPTQLVERAIELEEAAVSTSNEP